MKRKISLLILLFILISSIPISVKADDPSSFELLPNVDSVTYGSTFNISVFVSPNASINDAAIDLLTYSSSLIHAVAHNGTDNVSKGNIFNSGTTLLWRSGKINNSNGTITDIAWVVTPAKSNEGYLCNITFEAVGVGTAYINISDATIAYDIYVWEHQIISNSTITITSGLLNEDITTDSATGVEETNATLHGHLYNAEGVDIGYGFHIGTTTSYGLNYSCLVNLSFEENEWIENGLVETSWYNDLTVFTMDDETYMVVGRYDYKCEGYHWNKTSSSWEENVTMITGFPSAFYSFPCAIYMEGKQRLVVGTDGPNNFSIYDWNTTGWVYNATISYLLYRSSSWPSPSAFVMNGTYYIIEGSSTGYFYGHRWTGSQWTADSSIVSGLTDIGSYSRPTVFTIFDRYYLISGSFSGTCYAWYWEDDTWIRDDDLCSGLVYGDTHSRPHVFEFRDKYYAIVGGGGYGDEDYMGFLARFPYNGSFSYNAQDLSPGTLYHYKAYMNDTIDEYSNNDETFLTKPYEPTSFDAAVYNSTGINLTWTKGIGANKTVVLYKTTGYPSNPTDGSIIYNNTGATYNHTVVENSTNYYRAWSYTTWASLSQMSDSYGEDYALAVNYSGIIVVNATTLVEETSATLNGYVGQHNSSNARVGFVYDTEYHDGIDDYAYNITCATGIDNSTAFSSPISALQKAEYYYVKTWLRLYNDETEEYEWYLSNTTSYFLTKPEGPQNLTIETVGESSFSVTWNETEEFGDGTTIQTVVRYEKNEYPTSPTGGDGSSLAYNGTDELCLIEGLDDDSLYYVRVWTCAHASGSPHLYQYSDSYDSASDTTFSGVYNISVRYENRTYGPVNLSRGHYHHFVVYYSHTTEVNEFNNTGVMNGGNDTVGDWGNTNEGWFTINLTHRPLFFEFYWNASSTYLNGSGNVTDSIYKCQRIIVPDETQRNVTFYIRDDLPVYYDTSFTKNHSLIRYTMSFIDTSGEFVPSNNPYAIIFTYNDDNEKMVIHSEYFDSTKVILPMLVYDKRYYIGVSCDAVSFERISTYIAGDEQNPKIIIPYRYTSTFTFFDIMELEVGWYASGFFVNYQDTTGYASRVTFYVWDYNNDTLMFTETKYVSIYNFTYVCNTSKAWKYNLEVVLDDTDTDDEVDYSGTYWLANPTGATIIFPGIDYIVTINTINDIFQIMFGDSPMYNDDTGASVEWTYIAMFGFSFILLVTFGKVNAFVGSLAVGLFLAISGGYIFGLVSSILVIGIFIIGISIVGLMGGVDTR